MNSDTKCPFWTVRTIYRNPEELRIRVLMRDSDSNQPRCASIAEKARKMKMVFRQCIKTYESESVSHQTNSDTTEVKARCLFVVKIITGKNLLEIAKRGREFLNKILRLRIVTAKLGKSWSSEGNTNGFLQITRTNGTRRDIKQILDFQKTRWR